MGYGISIIDKYSQEVDFMHYPESDKDRPLHKALNMNIRNNDKIEKPFSLGQILEAKSKLMNVTGTLYEQDFLYKAILAMKETNVKSILIIFN
jgi:hypothetical protein